mmetsp:Transcript_105121/g.297423  ORF Transcript_105121/g.297423 Transcript_105121/m.297423 type:complete len:112 (+) Transcript_105121:89-424(+)
MSWCCASEANQEQELANVSLEEFTVAIDKREDRSAKLGLDITRNDDGGMVHLRIKAIYPGHITRWNKANPDLAVREDDLILKVNDECRSSGGLLERIVTDTTIEMTVGRPS